MSSQHGIPNENVYQIEDEEEENDESQLDKTQEKETNSNYFT